MTNQARCPQCGTTVVVRAGACSSCGAVLAARLQWLPFIVTVLGLATLLGVGSAWLLGGRGGFLIGPIAAIGVLFLSRFFRKLTKA